MSQGRKDLRAALLALLAAVLSTTPWLLLGGACLRARAGQSIAASATVQPPCVALTFDDGPRRETTTLLLDGLAQRGVHATFFPVGERVAGNEDLILRMEREGHQVGIHSQRHRVLTGLSDAQLRDEVETLNDTLSNLLGGDSLMLRPPYGLVDDGLLRRVGHPIILWSVDPEDWSDHDVQRQTAHILDRVQDGDIILLHDIYDTSVETALQVADALLKKGFRLVSVEELFALRGETAEAGAVYRSLPPG